MRGTYENAVGLPAIMEKFPDDKIMYILARVSHKLVEALDLYHDHTSTLTPIPSRG